VKLETDGSNPLSVRQKSGKTTGGSGLSLPRPLKAHGLFREINLPELLLGSAIATSSRNQA